MDMLFYLQPHLSPSPRPVQQAREIRTPFTALPCGFIFNRDAGTGRQPGRASGAGRRLLLLLPLPRAGSPASSTQAFRAVLPQPAGSLPVKGNPVTALSLTLDPASEPVLIQGRWGGVGRERENKGKIIIWGLFLAGCCVGLAYPVLRNARPRQHTAGSRLRTAVGLIRDSGEHERLNMEQG